MPTFRTTEGLEIAIAPVSMRLAQMILQKVERELRAEGLPLDPPTYTVETALGQKETYPLDTESAETDEQKAQLAAYEAANLRKMALYRERLTTAAIKRGIKIGPPPAEWVKEMKAEGFDLPEAPDDLRAEYLLVEYLKTPADISGVVLAILKLSSEGAPQEDIDSVRATFQH